MRPVCSGGCGCVCRRCASDFDVKAGAGGGFFLRRPARRTLRDEVGIFRGGMTERERVGDGRCDLNR